MKPQLSESRVREILTAGKVSHAVAILAVRQYYRDTLGERGKNDVGIFDDAFFAVGPGGFFNAIQANTDPSRIGWNSSIGKPFAMLVPGLHYFYSGAHKGRRPAFRQAEDEQTAKKYGMPGDGRFPVYRGMSMDEVLAGTARVDLGYHQIDIHDSQSEADHRTSSWGCLTAKSSIWKPFGNAVIANMKTAKQLCLPVLLVVGPLN